MRGRWAPLQWLLLRPWYKMINYEKIEDFIWKGKKTRRISSLFKPRRLKMMRHWKNVYQPFPLASENLQPIQNMKMTWFSNLAAGSAVPHLHPTISLGKKKKQHLVGNLPSDPQGCFQPLFYLVSQRCHSLEAGCLFWKKALVAILEMAGR